MSTEQTLVYKRLAFHAILDQEEPRLTRIKPLIDSLREEIDAIGVHPPQNEIKGL
jgi:hypothetical protein